MANLQSQIQEDHLTCVICNEIYRQPKALPCLHTFCKICLHNYILSKNFRSKGRFPCPMCRQDILIPPQNVDGFPDNHLIASLIDTLADPNTNQQETTSNEGPISTEGQRGLENNSPYGMGTERHISTEGFRNLENNPTNREIITSSPPTYGTVSANSDSIVPKWQGVGGSKFGFCKFGDGIVDLTTPIGLAVCSNGSIILSDQRMNRILVFDMAGNIEKSFTTGPSTKVFDLTTTLNGHILACVSSEGSELVQQFNLNGQKIENYGNLFNHVTPHGITTLHTINNGEEIVVTTTEPVGVNILGKGGKLIQHFGHKGAGEGAFRSPLYVCSDHQNQIYVSDCDNNAIKIFDRFSRFKSKIGEAGSTPGKLIHPKGIAIDKEGNIIIADFDNYRIQIFSPSGKFLGMAVENTRDTIVPGGQTAKPLLVALSRSNRELVVVVTGDQYAQIRVYPYRLKQNASISSSICVCS